MRRAPKRPYAWALVSVLLSLSAARAAADGFVCLPLGVGGGLVADDLSAYLVAPAGSTDFVALDAGTLLDGLQVAERSGALAALGAPAEGPLTPAGWMLQVGIKAYLVSHPHLDHVAGLVLASPDDTPKPILGTADTIDTLRDSLFNGQVWVPFGDEGAGRPLKRYRYGRLTPGETRPIEGTGLSVRPFLLSHASPGTSTAFLLATATDQLLYLGDTGPDAVEQGDRLGALWAHVAPLVAAKTLRALFIEVSYPDGRPDHLLFGHLTPAWLLTELHRLAARVDPNHPNEALRGLKVVVTHIKPSLQRGPSPRELIQAQLGARNDLGVTFIFPERGRPLTL